MSIDNANEGSVDTGFDEGVLGDEYEIVGIFNEDAPQDSGYEFEIFIVASPSEV